MVQRGPFEYVINLGRRDDYIALFEALNAQPGLPQQILHLWNVTAAKPQGARSWEFHHLQKRGFYSLLYLAQAGRSKAREYHLLLRVFADGLQDVIGDEELTPEKATLLGICKVIQQESQNIASQCVDLVKPEPGSIQESDLLDQVWASLDSAPTEMVVAYRGKQRWQQLFSPFAWTRRMDRRCGCVRQASI